MEYTCNCRAWQSCWQAPRTYPPPARRTRRRLDRRTSSPVRRRRARAEARSLTSLRTRLSRTPPRACCDDRLGQAQRQPAPEFLRTAPRPPASLLPSRWLRSRVACGFQRDPWKHPTWCIRHNGSGTNTERVGTNRATRLGPSRLQQWHTCNVAVSMAPTMKLLMPAFLTAATQLCRSSLRAIGGVGAPRAPHAHVSSHRRDCSGHGHQFRRSR